MLLTHQKTTPLRRVSDSPDLSVQRLCKKMRFIQEKSSVVSSHRDPRFITPHFQSKHHKMIKLGMYQQYFDSRRIEGEP